MLLAIHSLGLGGVWLGEILKNKEKVGDLLGTGKDLELMAVLALGYHALKPGKGQRDSLDKKVILRK